MHMDIRFPHLGIVLNHVGKTIYIGKFSIAYYGILIAIGILAGMALAMHLAKKSGQSEDDYFNISISGVIVGIICARIYYVIFAWDIYKNDLLSIFNLRGGGLAIYGGIIGAVLTMFVYSRIKKLSFLQITDTITPAIALGQIIGRWGNFCNREAFGEYTDSLLAMQLPLDSVFSSSVTETMRQNLVNINGVDYIQVHPTFLYESLWNCAVLAVMLIYWKHRKNNGEVFMLYLGGYGLGRVWIEGLRTDQLWIPGTQIPVSQVLAGVLIVVSVIGFILIRRHNKQITVTDSAEEPRRID